MVFVLILLLLVFYSTIKSYLNMKKDGKDAVSSSNVNIGGALGAATNSVMFENGVIGTVILSIIFYILYSKAPY